MTEFLVLVAVAKDGAIATLRLADDGTLTPLATNPVGADVSTFAVDRERDRVYASSKDGPSITTLRLDRGTGVLTPTSSRETGFATHYLALTQDGGRLLVAAYFEGCGTAQLVDGDGVVSPVTGRVDHANSHSVAQAGAGSHAYVVSLGEDCVVQCSLGEDGSLTPLDPPTVAAPKGSGPRHIVIDDAEKNVYVITEFGADALHYTRDTATGLLTLADSVTTYDPSKGLEHSAFGRDPRADHLIWGADIHLVGDTLYCSERTEATIATVPVNPDGTLGQPLAYTPTEPQPRGFGVSPDGRWLVAAGELSTTVTLYDLTDRVPRPVAQQEVGNGANWVRIIPA